MCCPLLRLTPLLVTYTSCSNCDEESASSCVTPACLEQHFHDTIATNCLDFALPFEQQLQDSEKELLELCANDCAGDEIDDEDDDTVADNDGVFDLQQQLANFSLPSPTKPLLMLLPDGSILMPDEPSDSFSWGVAGSTDDCSYADSILRGDDAVACGVKIDQKTTDTNGDELVCSVDVNNNDRVVEDSGTFDSIFNLMFNLSVMFNLLDDGHATLISGATHVVDDNPVMTKIFCHEERRSFRTNNKPDNNDESDEPADVNNNELFYSVDADINCGDDKNDESIVMNNSDNEHDKSVICVPSYPPT